MKARLDGKQFAALAALVVVAGFAGGVVSERFLHAGDATAQERPNTSTIYVGQGGLVFRSVDGRALARLGGDATGGFIEVYNSREQPAARLRPGSALDMPAPPERVLGPQPPQLRPEVQAVPAYTSRQTWPNDLGF